MKNYFFIAVLLLCACTTPDPVQTPDFEYAKVLGRITEKQLDEISGIAISQRSNEILWMINDSGDDANIYAVTRSGELAGKIKINGLKNRDWEDMSSFQYNGEYYLLIAEIGDNDARYDDYHIYIVPEPDLETGLPEMIDVAWQIDFTYPDGALDCEAVAVDLGAEKIVLLSKRHVPPRLYELPLAPDSPQQIAEFMGEVNSIPQPDQDDLQDYLGKYSAQPTALDIRADGSQIAVLTYKHLFLYVKAKEEDCFTAISRTPAKILFPRLSPAESACYDLDQQKIIITTEDVPAPIILIDPLKF